MTIIEIKKKMADLLRECGWCQNQLVNSNGERCLTGAFSKVFSVRTTSPRWLNEWQSVREDLKVRCNGNIAAWNDVSGRTIEEVLELLEAP